MFSSVQLQLVPVNMKQLCCEAHCELLLCQTNFRDLFTITITLFLLRRGGTTLNSTSWKYPFVPRICLILIHDLSQTSDAVRFRYWRCGTLQHTVAARGYNMLDTNFIAKGMSNHVSGPTSLALLGYCDLLLLQWGGHGGGSGACGVGQWWAVPTVGSGGQWWAVVGSGGQWWAVVGSGGQWWAVVGSGGQWWAVVGSGGQWWAVVGSGGQWWAVVGSGGQWWAVVGSGGRGGVFTQAWITSAISVFARIQDCILF